MALLSLTPEKEHELSAALQSLPRDKRRLLGWLVLFLFVGVVGLLWYANDAFSVEVPASGGSLREGIVGTPRFINPLLALSEADRDLTALVYSGLMRATPDGDLIPDLAESHETSENGLIHTFVLRENLTWHDGKPMTTGDVEFTVTKAQDPTLKSPRRPGWEGVRVEVVDERTINFHLKQRYASFAEVTTMGIVPKHLWGSLATDQFSFTELNISPVGSGPYKISKVRRDDDGIPRSIELAPFAKFALGAPHIKKITTNFYPNEAALVEAFENNQVDSLSAISAESAANLAEDGANILTAPLPRIFAVFYNQNKAPVFAQKEVREALSLAIDRELIIANVLKSYGSPINGPLPVQTEEEIASSTSRVLLARDHLEKNGWTWDETAKSWSKTTKAAGKTTLAFSLATAEAPELRQAAEIVKNTWESVGAKVDLKIYELGDLNKDVIRPRDYEALLFGQVLGRTPDLLSFWHSSQRLDPGLNVALYTNISVDRLLDDIRNATSTEARSAINARVGKIIADDVPAAFLYAPDLIYVVPKRAQQVSLPQANTASDRFTDIYNWYISTDKVWKIFIKET